MRLATASGNSTVRNLIMRSWMQTGSGSGMGVDSGRFGHVQRAPASGSVQHLAHFATRRMFHKETVNLLPRELVHDCPVFGSFHHDHRKLIFGAVELERLEDLVGGLLAQHVRSFVVLDIQFEIFEQIFQLLLSRIQSHQVIGFLELLFCRFPDGQSLIPTASLAHEDGITRIAPRLPATHGVLIGHDLQREKPGLGAVLSVGAQLVDVCPHFGHRQEKSVVDCIALGCNGLARNGREPLAEPLDPSGRLCDEVPRVVAVALDGMRCRIGQMGRNPPLQHLVTLPLTSVGGLMNRIGQRESRLESKKPLLSAKTVLPEPLERFHISKETHQKAREQQIGSAFLISGLAFEE